ncbi:hypothetical protein KKA08_06725 [bacterium]|nr:hypothetical protein [bacterium]
MYSAWDGDRKLAVRPRFEGRQGHPVLLGRLWLDKVLKALYDSSMRDLLRSNSEQVLSLNVNDSGILIDVDTPEDYQQLIRE